MPRAKKITLTAQIAELVNRKKKINEGKRNMTASIQTHQARLDEAEAILVDLITTQMSDDTAQNREAASEARIDKNVILQQFDQHNYDLKMLPEALKKLDAKIKELTAQKVLLERELIADKLGDIEELKQNAREALAVLTAAVCMQTTRSVQFTGVREVAKQLDKDDSASRLFIHKFNELNDKMGFEKL